MKNYATIPYTQNPVAILGMLRIHFDSVIKAHMNEQKEVLVQGLTNFSTHPGCKTLTDSKTSQTAQ